MSRGWRCSIGLDALEVVEGLEAVEAAIQRLARGRAELGDALGMLRAAAWAGEGKLAAEQLALVAARALGGRDAVGRELRACRVVEPVRRPRRSELRRHARVPEALRRERAGDVARDRVHRRAARVGRRDDDL